MGRVMSKLPMFLLTAAVIATSASAAQHVKRVTIAQLSQLLSAAHGEKDSKLAQQLSALVLTQRVSAANLARWRAEFHGKHTRQALTELADASAFLDLPGSEVPTDPPPDMDSQRKLIVRTIGFVNKALTKLPNFYAVRTTTHFEDTSAMAPSGITPCLASEVHSSCAATGTTPASAGPLNYAPLHSAGQSRVIVTYRDGKEVVESRWAKATSPWKHPLGLVTSGEFGPIFSVVLGDAVHGSIVWGNWERGANGPLAVFRFRVPAASSHYVVSLPARNGEESLRPAYHGEIAIDPHSGAIYRIAIVADPDPSHQDVVTAIMVRYGPVAIGGKTYICPVKGVALSKVPIPHRKTRSKSQQPLILTRLNDTRFTSYHLFRADMTILPGAPNLLPPAAGPSSPQH